MQYTLALLANLFYNRQSRLKVLRFLRVDEDEVIQRIRLLEKLPSQIVLTVSLRQEEVESVHSFPTRRSSDLRKSVV